MQMLFIQMTSYSQVNEFLDPSYGIDMTYYSGGVYEISATD